MTISFRFAFDAWSPHMHSQRVNSRSAVLAVNEEVNSAERFDLNRAIPTHSNHGFTQSGERYSRHDAMFLSNRAPKALFGREASNSLRFSMASGEMATIAD
jgi:hypothetical protein